VSPVTNPNPKPNPNPNPLTLTFPNLDRRRSVPSHPRVLKSLLDTYTLLELGLGSGLGLDNIKELGLGLGLDNSKELGLGLGLDKIKEEEC
jgi:hypothetical protein